MPFFALIFGQMTDAYSPQTSDDEVVRQAGI
jgi:hypothetical protein